MEISAFFVAWLYCLVHVIFRPAKNAWFEQTLVAVVSFISLAVVGICMPFERIKGAVGTADITYLSFFLGFVLCGAVFFSTSVLAKSSFVRLLFKWRNV